MGNASVSVEFVLLTVNPKWHVKWCKMWQRYVNKTLDFMICAVFYEAEIWTIEKKHSLNCQSCQNQESSKYTVPERLDGWVLGLSVYAWLLKTSSIVMMYNVPILLLWDNSLPDIFTQSIEYRDHNIIESVDIVLTMMVVLWDYFC